jgi:hypothetical protein
VASNITITTAVKNAMLAAFTALIDAGTPPGFLNIYDSTGTGQPAGPATAVSTQVRLAHLTFSSTSFAAPSAGATAANTITSDTSAVAGTATWFRITNAAATAILDGTVGLSGCDINFNTVTFSTGATIACTSLTFTHP